MLTVSIQVVISNGLQKGLDSHLIMRILLVHGSIRLGLATTVV